MSYISSIKAAVSKLGSAVRKAQVQRFFKTGKGQYGQGDIFAGLTLPDCRQIAKNHSQICLSQTQQLLKSEIHQQRIIALVILISHYDKRKKQISKNAKLVQRKDYKQGGKLGKKQLKQIFDLYIGNTKYVNNWDLVDISAPKIVGDYLLEYSEQKDILYQLAKSQSLWERRISIVSTLTFIKADEFLDTLNIAKILLSDKHDLIHKGTGWMLREVGKKDEELLCEFLRQNYEQLPRTTLRYAIQKFEQGKRQSYLKGHF